MSSYLTVSPLPAPPKGPLAVCSLLRLPSAFAAWTLSSALLCGVRTFLDRRPGVLTRSDATPAGRGHLACRRQDTTTGTIKLKGTFENADHRLWPGQFSTVLLRLAEDENATVVPSQAVQTGQNGDIIWVVKTDKTVEQRSVKVGRTVGADSVILSGVRPGETVVTDGQLRLIPNMRVQITNPVSSS